MWIPRIAPGIALVLGMGLASVPAGAASLQLLNDQRGVAITSYDPGSDEYTLRGRENPSAPFADFDARVDYLQYTSAQQSRITPTRIEARLIGFGNESDVDAAPWFVITFATTEPTPVRLRIDWIQDFGSFVWLFADPDPSGFGTPVPPFFGSTDTGEVDPVDVTGTLAPGTYALHFYSARQYSDLHLVFEVVPEPGTSLLVGAGLATLALRRRAAR